MTQGALSEIEKGNTKTSIDTVLSISRHFNLTTDWLIKGES
ncbi:helix-turn-helix domain-containing protein [Cytobacillus firmus]